MMHDVCMNLARQRIQCLSVAVVIYHLSQGEEGKSGSFSVAGLTRINGPVKEAIGYNAARDVSINILNSALWWKHRCRLSESRLVSTPS